MGYNIIIGWNLYDKKKKLINLYPIHPIQNYYPTRFFLNNTCQVLSLSFKIKIPSKNYIVFSKTRKNKIQR